MRTCWYGRQVSGPCCGTFQPAKHLVILRTEDWVLNHRVDSALPGYLMLGTRVPTNDLSLLRPEALAQLGTLLANAQKALNTRLKPQHLYIGRYGHTAGHALHFHLIPICGWVRQSFGRARRRRNRGRRADALRLAGVLREPSSTADLRAFGPRSSRAIEGADASRRY